MQSTLAQNIGEMSAKIRKYTSLPIAVGFGISNPDQARTVASHSEAIVVGSAIVNQIAAKGKNSEMVATVRDFTKSMVDAVKSLS